MTLQTLFCVTISAGVNGGLSGGSSVRRPGSQDPHRRQWKLSHRLKSITMIVSPLQVLVCDNFEEVPRYSKDKNCKTMARKEDRMANKIYSTGLLIINSQV